MMRSWRFISVSFIILGITHLCAVVPDVQDQAARQALMAATKDRFSLHRFDNGVNLVCVPFQNTNAVVVGLKLFVGAADEGPREWGMAHILEHMWFKGSKNRVEGQLHALCRKFAMAPGEYNAQTSWDATYYYFVSDAANWSVFSDLLLDGIANFDLDREALTSELGAISQEIKYRHMDKNRLGFADFFPMNHPYSHEIIGYKEQVLSFTAEDVLAFFKKHYVLSRCTVIVCGGVAPEQVRAHVGKTFGAVSVESVSPAAAAAPEVRDPFYAGFASTTKTLYHEHPYVHLMYQWLGAPLGSADAAALSVAASVLQRRLQQKWVDDQALCLAVGVGHEALERAGCFYVSLHPRAEHVDLDFKRMIQEEIEMLGKGDISADEWNRVHHEDMARLVALSTDPVSCAHAIAGTLTRFSPDCATNLFADAEYHAQITAGELAAIVTKYLNPLRCSVQITRPLPEAEKVHWQQLQQKMNGHEQALLAARTRGTAATNEAFVLPDVLPLSRVTPAFTSFTLPNGLEVHLHAVQEAPTCVFGLTLKKSEALLRSLCADGKSFAVNELVYLASQGTRHHTKKELDALMDSLGASMYGWAGVLYVSSLHHRFKQSLELLKEVLDEPLLTHETFEKHKKELLEVFDRSVNALPGALSDFWAETVYKPYPWMMTRAQERAALENASVQDVHTILSLMRDPSRVVAVMAGDFSREQAYALAEEVFGSWGAACPDYGVPHEVPAPGAVCSGHVDVENEGCLVAAMRPTITLFDQDAPALALLESYLKKTVWDVRERTGLFYAGGISVSVGGVEVPGACACTVLASPPTAPAVREELRSLIMAVHRFYFDEELTASLQQEYAHAHNKYAHTASFLALFGIDAVAKGLPFSWGDDFAARVAAVTPAQLNAVVKKYFDPADWAFVTVGRALQK